MTIFFLLGSISVLLMGNDSPLTLHFESEIEFFSISKKGSFNTHISKNKKILTLKSNIKEDTSLVVVTKVGIFEFLLKHSKSPMTLVHVKMGKEEKNYRVRLNKKEFKYLEGEKSAYIVFNKEKRIKINSREYFSKKVPIVLGSPIFMEGLRVW